MITLKGGAALVTGASRGIGRGIALKLAESGFRCIGVHYHKNEAAAAETQRLLADRGAEGVPIQADVTRAEDIASMFASARERLGPSLDVFVANARPDLQHFYQPALDIPLESWRATMDSQATALLLGVREAAKLMNKGGRIIAVTYAPGAQTGSWRSWGAMGPAKAAMESLLRYFAWDLAPRGITVNAVSPGATDDSVLSTLPPAVLDALRERAAAGWVPMRRLTTPADVGDAVTLLCSEQAGFVTGQTLHVDGGASLALADCPMELQAGG